jgi:hypothetical protein
MKSAFIVSWLNTLGSVVQLSNWLVPRLDTYNIWDYTLLARVVCLIGLYPSVAE